MKILKRILLGTVTIILGLLLIFNIYNFINIKILKNDFTSINGYVILEVVSGSMEPTIKVGDLIVINTKDQHYQENDIVTFYDTNGAFVTHRIVSIQDDKMITKGDNNNTSDEATPISNIVGKYVFKIGFIGSLITALKNPVVSIMIFILGILICYWITYNEENEIIKEEDKEAYLAFLEAKEAEVKKKEKANTQKKKR